MTGHDSKGPMTFHDVAAYFSEEEWKLLHEWQKEIYRNVMKDIQQVLLSLGPLIATSVFSLRIKEKDTLYPEDHDDFQGKPGMDRLPSDTIVPSNMIFGINRDEAEYVEDPPDKNGSQSHAPSHTAGLPTPITDGDLKRNATSEALLTAHRGSKAKESSPSSSAGHEASTQMIMMSIKEEEETYPLAHQDYEGSAYPLAHPESERSDYPLALLDYDTSEGRRYPTVQGVKTSLNTYKQQETMLDESYLSNECGHSYSHRLDMADRQGIHAGEDAYECNEYGSSCNTISDKVTRQETHVLQKQYTWAECGKSLSESAALSPHGQVDTGLKLCLCTICGAYFRQSANIISHQQMNTDVENTCSECKKTARKPSPQQQIQRLNMDQRPYMCSECGKSFRQSRNLVTHQRIHTGEKPYACSVCGKSFRQSKNLITHRRIHTGEKPYVCSVCEKRFSDMANLITHQRIHTGEKPYACNICGKNFRQLPHLNKHQRTHMVSAQPERGETIKETEVESNASF